MATESSDATKRLGKQGMGKQRLGEQRLVKQGLVKSAEGTWRAAKQQER